MLPHRQSSCTRPVMPSSIIMSFSMAVKRFATFMARADPSPSANLIFRFIGLKVYPSS